MKKTRLILLIFDPIFGPVVFASIPEELPEEISEYVKNLFEYAKNGFFEHLKEDKPHTFRSSNYCFETFDPVARGKTQSLMLSLLMPTNEQPASFQTLIQRTMLRITNLDNIHDKLFGNSKQVIFDILEDTLDQINMEQKYKGYPTPKRYSIPRIYYHRSYSEERTTPQVVKFYNNKIEHLKPFVEFAINVQRGTAQIPKLKTKDLEVENNIGTSTELIYEESITNSGESSLDLSSQEIYMPVSAHKEKRKMKRVPAMEDFLGQDPLYGIDGIILQSGEEIPDELTRVSKEIPTFVYDSVINTRSWEIFLKRIYIKAMFRKFKLKPTIQSLLDFHTKNKLLFMSFNQDQMEKLEQVLSHETEFAFSKLIKQYEQQLQQILKETPTRENHTRVLKYVLEFFEDKISASEKNFFIYQLERFRRGVLELKPLHYVLKSWFVRFNEDYLQHQTYFQPYPEELNA